MVALVHTRSAAQDRHLEGAGFVVLNLLRRFAAMVAYEIRTRRDLTKLQSLDDAMLHDIGLSRGEIEHAVRHARATNGSAWH